MSKKIQIIAILTIYFYGSFFCKNILNSTSEYSLKKDFIASSPQKMISRLMLLNKKTAISQYYQLLMIAYFTKFDVPVAHHHHHDHHGHTQTCLFDIKQKIIKKYMLTHSQEFFDLNKYYKLMELSLEFDPKNLMVREIGMHLSYTTQMMELAIKAIKKGYHVQPSWDIAFDIGWIYFYVFKDNQKARLWFKKAMSFADAPERAENFHSATFFLDKKFTEAIKLTKEKIARHNDPKIKGELQNKLNWYQGFLQISIAAKKYKKTYRKDINKLEELIEADLLSEIPYDPIGNGFYWDKKKKEPASKDSPYNKITHQNTEEIIS